MHVKKNAFHKIILQLQAVLVARRRRYLDHIFQNSDRHGGHMIQRETVSVGVESHAFHLGGKPAPAERHSCRCFLNSSLTNNNSSLLSELK